MDEAANLQSMVLDLSIPVTESGCWIWMGRYGGRGNAYGRICVNGKEYGAHRFSYTAFVGKIPAGLLVCHHCDVKECVNPNHLYAGTVQDNARDAVSRNRYNPWTRHLTRCKRGHEFSEENTRMRPDGFRECRTCLAEYKRQYYAEHRTTWNINRDEKMKTIREARKAKHGTS